MIDLSETKWIAMAFDSADVYALGDTEEEAEAAYIEKFGEPEWGLGLSVIRNKSDYQFELKLVSNALGLGDSMPVYMAAGWICVSRITKDGLALLEARKKNGNEKPKGLRHRWTREGEYFVDSRIPNYIEHMKEWEAAKKERRASKERRAQARLKRAS